jgi:hypothetical protein
MSPLWLGQDLDWAQAWSNLAKVILVLTLQQCRG